MRSIILTCSGILLLVTPSAGAEVKVTTSCYVPSVAEGQSTGITCNFSTDISALRRNFKVEFHANKTNETEEAVLDCRWNNEGLECDTHDCCTFDKNVTNSLRVQIRNATTKRVGKYICYVMPVSSGSSNFCNFNISVQRNFSEAEAGEPKEVAGMGSHFGACLVAVVILSILLVCFLVVTILVCVFCKGIRERTRTLYRSVRRFVNNPRNSQSSTSEGKMKGVRGNSEQSTVFNEETKRNSNYCDEEERKPLVNNVSANADSPEKIVEEPPNLTESVHGNQNIDSIPECQSSDLNESCKDDSVNDKSSPEANIASDEGKISTELQGSPHTAEEQEQHSHNGAAPLLSEDCNDDSSSDTSTK